jgi:hypothetical protein
MLNPAARSTYFTFSAIVIVSYIKDSLVVKLLKFTRVETLKEIIAGPSKQHSKTNILPNNVFGGLSPYPTVVIV